MSVARQFFVYGLGGAASRLAAIVLVPLYTRSLPITEFGRLEIALSLHALAVLLAGMQVESAIARDYLEAGRTARAASLRRAALLLTIVGSVSLFSLLALAAIVAPTAQWLTGTELVLLGAMTLPAQLFGVQLVMLRFAGRATLYALLSFADLALAALVSFGLIVVLGWGVPGALTGILVAKLVCAALAWRSTFSTAGQPGVVAGETRAWSHRLLAYGVPALPAVLVGWLHSQGNRFIVGGVLTLDDIALTGVAMKVGALLGFVVYSLRLAWEPHAMARLEAHASDPRYFSRALEWYVAAMFPLLVLTLIAAPWIVRALAPPIYAGAAAAALLMILAQYWVGVSVVTVIGIHGARLTGRLLPVYGWGAVANVVTLVATAGLLGPAAAGLGLATGSIVSAALAAAVSNRVFDTGFSPRLLAGACAATLLLTSALSLTIGRGATPAGADLRAALEWIAVALLAAAVAGGVLVWAGYGKARWRLLVSQGRRAIARSRNG